MTVYGQYRLWYVFLFAMLLPFMPRKVFTPEIWPASADFALSGNPVLPAVSRTFRPELTDYPVSAVSSGSLLDTVVWGIWIIGMVIAALFYCRAVRRIHLLKAQAYPILPQTEPDLYRQYHACLSTLKIRREVRLYASCQVEGPVSCGWIHPFVMIPQDLDLFSSEREIRFVFLHELQHYRHKDALLNHFVSLLWIVYWFNPAIWYGFRQLRKDREIACDNAVLQTVGEDRRLDYGQTILRYARQMRQGFPMSPLSAIGGHGGALRQRILEIADYRTDTPRKKLTSTVALLLAVLTVYGSSPLYTTYAAYTPSFWPEKEQIEAIDVSSYFHEAEGTFVLYDLENDQYKIYNQELSAKRISPYSTFKIYSGLFALEENVISPDATFQRWNGDRQPYDAWNRDHTLKTAMENSVNWYFQNLDRQLGLSRLSTYYDKVSYGNCDLTGGIDRYWAGSSLKISPVEQTRLLADLLENRWGFRQQNIDAVKHSLYLSDIPAGTLYGKTGTGISNDFDASGWFVGFIETKERTYCFATNIRGSRDASGSLAARITLNILYSNDF